MPNHEKFNHEKFLLENIASACLALVIVGCFCAILIGGTLRLLGIWHG